MKPKHVEALGFECPKCFTKSCFHADKYSIDTYNGYKILNKNKIIVLIETVGHFAIRHFAIVSGSPVKSVGVFPVLIKNNHNLVVVF